MEPKYPKTLKAAKAVSRSGYSVATALWEEVAKTSDGHAERGELQRVREFLTKNDSETYTAAWLSELHALGGWIVNSELTTLPMPPRMAMEARKSKAKLTPTEAVAQWQLGNDGKSWTLRTWSAALGRKWSDVASETAAELVEEAESAGIGMADVITETVAHSPESISEAAGKSQDVLDAAYEAVHDHMEKTDKPERPEKEFTIDDLFDLYSARAGIYKLRKLSSRLATLELNTHQREQIEGLAVDLEFEATVLRALAENPMTIEELLSV